jgi:hypothetical protein
MKRYMLFGGEQYYARGGMNDFHGFFDEVESALGYIREYNVIQESSDFYDPSHPDIDWWHLYDNGYGFTAVATEEQAYGNPSYESDDKDFILINTEGDRL